MKGKIVGWPQRYYLDGVQVSKEEFEQAFPPQPQGAPGGHGSACWPMLSDALAVHPGQIQEAMERNKRHGLHVEYTEDGRPKLMDRGQRRDLMRAEGFHDNNGGYGDDHA
jgi:hypothetical protein